MITLDKIKLANSLDCMKKVDPANFYMKTKDDEVVSMKLTMKQPFALDIEINYEKEEVVIEFTGKVLGERYPELISLDTIQDCFERINALGYCYIDGEKMMKADVVKCDVTKDVPIPDTSSLNRYIRGHIRNYQAYVCRLNRNGNLIVEKNVTCRASKRRVTLYDKGEEMKRSSEQNFVLRYGLENRFDGICRIEMNLNSQQAIRDVLDVTGTSLSEVLRSTRNPIQDFLSDIIQDDTEPNVSDTWKTYWQILVLQDCAYDLAKVEAKLREYKGGGIAKAITPFRELMESLPAGTSTWSKIKLLDVVR